MKVGSLVFSTNQGLGILAKSFYDNGVITDVMVIAHGSRPENHDWYPTAQRINSLRDPVALEQMKQFCKSADIMLFLETPYRWELINYCREIGVKTVLLVNYECSLVTMPAQPDFILCPSLLDLQYYPQGKFIPVPVDVPWKLRERCEVFVHNSGHGGLKGRNGTEDVVEAMKYVKSPIKLIIRAQDPAILRDYAQVDPRIELRRGTKPYSELWIEGDCFLFPERFNGLSLPLQEAYASGMLVMAGNRFPMNKWLPEYPLIPVSNYSTDRIGPPYNKYAKAIYDPEIIAHTVDAWYGSDISSYSLQGKEWAEANSWSVLKPVYQSYLEEVLAA